MHCLQGSMVANALSTRIYFDYFFAINIYNCYCVKC